MKINYEYEVRKIATCRFFLNDLKGSFTDYSVHETIKSFDKYI